MLLTVLAGCSRSQPARYYRLESGDPKGPATTATAKDTSGTLMLGLGPIVLPGYLDRPQMVTNGSGHQMNVNDYARWLEPLQESVTRVLRAQLQAGLPGYEVVLYPRVDMLAVPRRITVTIQRLDGTLNGEATLEASYEFYDGMTASPKFGSFHTTAPVGGDYGSYAATLNQLLLEFGKKLTATVQSVAPTP
jgi:uncharacterized lipoprotein YmbA